MALSEQRKKELDLIAQQKKPSGLSEQRKRELDAIAQSRTTTTPKGGGFVKDAIGDVKETFGALRGTVAKTKEEIDKIAVGELAGEQGKLRSFGQAVGNVAGGISSGFGDLIKGAVKTVLPQSAEDNLKENISKGVQSIIPVAQKIDQALGSPAGTFYKNYTSLDDKSKRDVKALLGISQFATDLATFGTSKKVADVAVEKTADVIGSGVQKGRGAIEDVKQSLQSIPEQPIIQGTLQKGQELAERVPRGVEKIREATIKSAQKAEAIKNAPEPVAKAIKSDLDQRIIDVVTNPKNPEDVANYKKMVDIAENGNTKLGNTKRPEIVAGEVASDQYKLIEDYRKAVGKQIEKEVNNLSLGKVNMEDDILNLMETLEKEGVEVVSKGKLNFKNANFSKQQESKIQELWELTTKSGFNLTPYQIYRKDQLFSQLKRETRFSEVGDVLIQTDEGKKNLFDVFRDVYNNKLNEVNPKIKELNTKYGEVRRLVDDIEDSIVKGGKFDATKNTDKAVFAQTNLRRILSDAQSAGAYTEILSKMDELARTLGYSGSSAEDMIAFATELRKLFPDAIPQTSFTGINRNIFSSVLEKVVNTGKPELVDQQKALKELLDYLLK